MENKNTCPYMDVEKGTCTHPRCIRMPGLECIYKKGEYRTWQKKKN